MFNADVSIYTDETLNSQPDRLEQCLMNLGGATLTLTTQMIRRQAGVPIIQIETIFYKLTYNKYKKKYVRPHLG